MNQQLLSRFTEYSDIENDSENVEQTLQRFNRLALRLQNSQLKLQRELTSLENELIEVDQQRLQELSEKEALADRLQSILEALPSGVIVLDANGSVEMANEAAKAIFEHRLEQFQWRDIIGDLFAPQPDDGHEISLRNGKRVGLATQGGMQAGGQIILVTDLTDTRALQNELAQSKRLAQLGQMAATLAHQIRTPLATAQLYLSELPKHREDEIKTKENIKKINTKLNLLNQQIEDMLLFSRRECQLNDTVELNQLLLEAIDSVRAKAEQAGVKIESQFLEEPIEFRCHYTALLGALVNILVNAIEASSAGQSIHILVDIDAETQRHRVQIIDHGVGFDSSQIDYLSEPFVSNKQGGTGLGMNVVKWVMESHQYLLKANSVPSKGSVITILLNKMNQEEKAPQKSQTQLGSQ